jgi:hypothetical protein
MAALPKGLLLRMFRSLYRIGALLVLAFFLYVIFNIMFFLPPNAKQRFTTFQKDAAQTIDPHTLRTWAIPIIATNGGAFAISNENLPWYVRCIGDPGNVRGVVFDSDGSKGLYIIWGGGFGNWGIIVCSSTQDVIHEDERMRIEPWIPGVYFFIDKK